MYTLTPLNKLIKIENFVLALDSVKPKEYYFAGEMHDFWEAVFVKSGNATAAGDERIYNLSAGNLLFHKPMEFHRIWSAGNSTPRLKILSFSASGQGMKMLEKQCFLLNESEISDFEDAFAAFDSFSQIREKNLPHEPEYSFCASKAAALFEAFLLDLIGKKSQPLTPLSADEEHYHKIVKTLEEHCTENLSVDELAKLCLMSKSNIKRIFSKYCDKGIAKYFLILKLRKAMQLLDGGHNASETAALSGFSEVSYFHNVFKREIGITPLQYKNRREGQLYKI